MLVLVGRLASLQIINVHRWREWASRQHLGRHTYSSYRHPIVDRWDRPLAISIPVESLSVRPPLLKEDQIAELADKLATILDMPVEQVSKQLRSKSPFVWIKRRLPRVVAQKLEKVKIAGEAVNGLEIVQESRRAYPYRESATVLLGRVGTDGNGLSGLEQRFDDFLKGNTFQRPMLRDAKGKLIAPPGSVDSLLVGTVGKGVDRNSKALRLTIDAEIQAIMADELERAYNFFQPKSAFALMVDSDNGEVLSIAQAPSANLNADKLSDPDVLQNLVTGHTFEPGSVIKPIIVASAIDRGIVEPDDVLDCSNGRYRFGGHWVRDTHPLKEVSVREIVVRSSNIGMGKIGERLGKEGVYDALRLFGFGTSVDLGLPGSEAGILRNVQSWATVDVATHSFGQGVSVTMPQMVRAYSAIANGGLLVPIRLFSKGEVSPSRRVISQSTAMQIQSMLRGVVEEEGGTGRNAAVSGIVIGGKTGTAQKARDDGKRGYDRNKYVTSFIGFAQGASIGVSQNVVLMVVVDTPQSSHAPVYGGTVAAPVFSSIIRRTFRYLSTTKSLSNNTTMQPDDISSVGA
jgi:cell division protein FtsI (penicillin-binding protein 3)